MGPTAPLARPTLASGTTTSVLDPLIDVGLQPAEDPGSDLDRVEEIPAAPEAPECWGRDADFLEHVEPPEDAARAAIVDPAGAVRHLRMHCSGRETAHAREICGGGTRGCGACPAGLCLPVYNADPMDIREELLAAVRKSRLSERRLSIEATGSSDTLRNIRRGAQPRADTLVALCRVLGLDVRLTPGLLPRKEDDEVAVRPPTEFSSALQLPVYDWTDGPEDGCVRRSSDGDRAPAPVDMCDERAFYQRMPDGSMAPARIAQSDYCLVSPHAQLKVDQRAWFRGPKGHETVNWVMRISAEGYDLGAWKLDERLHQKPTCIHRKQDDVVDRGVVLAVYKDRPTVGKPLQPGPDWHPDARAELFRAGLFAEELGAVSDGLEEAVSAVLEAEMRVKRMVGIGALSDPYRRLVLRIVDETLGDSLRRTRSSVIENRSDTNGDTSRQ